MATVGALGLVGLLLLPAGAARSAEATDSGGNAAASMETATETTATAKEASTGPAAVDPAELIARAVEEMRAGRSVPALEAAEDAYFAVWEKVPLAFRRVEVVSEPPSRYDDVTPRPTHAFAQDEEISIYVDPVGFGWERDGEEWSTDLVADFILETPEGRAIAGQKEFGTFRIRVRERAREAFLVLSYRFTGVPAGDYLLTTTLKDRVDDETAAFTTDLTIE